jgi:hypothetical protein
MKLTETARLRSPVDDVGATTDATLATITTGGSARRLPFWVRLSAIVIVSAFALAVAIDLLIVILDLVTELK